MKTSYEILHPSFLIGPPTRFLTKPSSKQPEKPTAMGRKSLPPILAFKCINRAEDIWAVRITRGYRAVGILEGDMVTWIWIGSHADYDKYIV